MSRQDNAVYLYCLAKADKLNAVGGFGIDQQNALTIATFKAIAAVYSTVDLDDFTGPEAEENFQDIRWIGPRALVHEKVVAQVSGTSPVLPARFGTIFSSFDRMQLLLTTKYDAIVEFLDRITDRQEWSVKGYVDKKQAVKRRAAEELAVQREALDKLAPGARYFHEKKLEAVAQQTVSAWLNEQIVAIADDLAPISVERVERKILSREATGKETDMILNLALLVDLKGVPLLEAAIQQINSESPSTGLVLELSGPWPPYSFCPTFSLDEDK